MDRSPVARRPGFIFSGVEHECPCPCPMVMKGVSMSKEVIISSLEDLHCCDTKVMSWIS